MQCNGSLPETPGVIVAIERLEPRYLLAAVNDFGFEGNGHYYALTPTAGTWEEAQSYAESLGGHLATITSAAEQDFITQAFVRDQFAGRTLWIGLVDSDQMDAFEWVTGEQ